MPKLYEDLVRSDRNPRRMAQVVDFLFARPILTTRQMAESLNMPFKTAAQYMSKLVRASLLRETTGYTRNRIYQADDILGKIEGLKEL